ncbi:MAG: response regulator [Pseudomonadota bacterium]
MSPTLHPQPPIGRTALTRLVLIEDDENVRRSMTMLLRARGFQIDTYRDGAEFLIMQGQHGGDCLLIDYKMPRMDGLEVMRRTRQRNDDTPAILITGFYSNSLKHRALQAGFESVLEKPARPDHLLATIGEAVS